ncbi:hypothetical protein DL96DRAFT_1182807 [Flagelloscypha sp. PMI_526]|nr:hypothetical protein DL96DRAFT_1182807 [Flagelloscypha sp. PMI_526]
MLSDQLKNVHDFDPCLSPSPGGLTRTARAKPYLLCPIASVSCVQPLQIILPVVFYFCLLSQTPIRRKRPHLSMSLAIGPVAAAVALPSAGSASRRKPQFVYRSPQAVTGKQTMPLIYPTQPPSPPATVVPSTLTKEEGGPSKSIVLLSTTAHPTAGKRKKFDMGPPLPLYHPFGALSSSLKPLDIAYTARHGLPPILPPEEPPRKVVGRASRSKHSSTDDSELAVMADIAVAASAQEAKPRAAPSPRKKGGRGGAAAAKRKRKDTDDGDPTYPAKRPRLPRGAAAKESSSADSPPERVSATPDEPPVEKKPSNRGGRRKGRGGRGAAAASRRRTSSGSEEVENNTPEASNTINDATPIGTDQDAASPPAAASTHVSPPPRPGSEPV